MTAEPPRMALSEASTAEEALDLLHGHAAAPFDKEKVLAAMAALV